MKKILLILSFLVSFAFAELKNIPATTAFVKSGITIIDIRTKPEWEQTGIVKDSIPITFFDERGGYDARAFLDKLNLHVKQGQEFAIICRTGNRTTAVSKFLNQQGYRVINLEGGVKALAKDGYEFSKYNP